MVSAEPQLNEELALLKDEGNNFFRSGDFLKAAGSYTKAIKAAGKDAAERIELAPIYSNRSASFLKLSKVKQALQDAEVCVKLRPDWEKAHYRKGMAQEAAGDENAALAAFEAALSTGSTNPEVKQKVKFLKNKSKFVFPKTTPKASANDDDAPPSKSKGAKGDPAWLEAARSPGQPVHVRIGAVNKVGNWLAGHLERMLKRVPGDNDWFFEEEEIAAFLDDGVVQCMLDVLTHTVVAIITAENSKDDNAQQAAAQGADLAGTATGVMHNLLHPALRAWSTRKQHVALTSAVMQVLRMEGSPFNDPKGTKVTETQETKQFTALAAKMLGSAEAFKILTGHAMLMRVRLSLLRSLIKKERKQGPSEEAEQAIRECSRALVVLTRCRAEGKWEPVIDRLLTDEGADEMRAEAANAVDQHGLLAGAFSKFGFEGSVGI